ncbi:hypothetical protein SVAN01_02796 [Stagonosporopsis vannaccii]|nr:hypothetical protein SVAN01_02796 [Stagonosporopsis vannaccii]
MAPVPIGEASTSALTDKVNTNLPKTPPLCLFKNVVDTPPHTLAAVDNPTTIGVDTIENTSEEIITERAQASRVDAKIIDICDGGEIIERGQDTTSQADLGNVELENMEANEDPITTRFKVISTANAHLPVATTEEADDKGRLFAIQTLPITRDEPALNIEPCKNLPDQSPRARASSATECTVPVTLNVDNNDSKDDSLVITKIMPMDSRTGQDKAGRDTQEDSFGDDEDTAVAAPEEARSVPPHMRSAAHAISAHSIVESRREWSAPVPRAPRAHASAIASPPIRTAIDYDEFRRTNAQLLKARSDLEAERTINAEIRKTVGAEIQTSVGAAMADMLSDLLQKQAETLMAKAKTQEKERELQCREQQITQLEAYLSEGQKQLKHQLEQRGIQLMSAADEAKLRREVELRVKHQLSDIEGKIDIQVERLRHQEAAQRTREHQYKVLVRDALETEIREQVAREMQAKNADSKAIEAAYERGIAEGKKEGGSRTLDTGSKDEFLKGYAACYGAQTALHKLRMGRITADSPELAFLYDPTHAENPHNVGLSIGRMAAEPVSNKLGAILSRSSMAEEADRAATTTGSSWATSSAVTLRGHGSVDMDSGTSHVADDSEQVRPAHQTRPQPVQQEEPIRRAAHPRATFASELRATASGVFTGRPTPSSAPTAPRTPTAATNGVRRAGVPGRVGEGVYARRRTVRYADSEDESTSPNLIDLY